MWAKSFKSSQLLVVQFILCSGYLEEQFCQYLEDETRWTTFEEEEKTKLNLKYLKWWEELLLWMVNWSRFSRLSYLYLTHRVVFEHSLHTGYLYVYHRVVVFVTHRVFVFYTQGGICICIIGWYLYIFHTQGGILYLYHRVVREGVADSRVHALLYFLPPTGHGVR